MGWSFEGDSTRLQMSNQLPYELVSDYLLHLLACVSHAAQFAYMGTIIFISQQLKLFFTPNIPQLGHHLAANAFYFIEPWLLSLVNNKINDKLTHFNKDSFFKILGKRLSHTDTVFKRLACQESCLIRLFFLSVYDEIGK